MERENRGQQVPIYAHRVGSAWPWKAPPGARKKAEPIKTLPFYFSITKNAYTVKSTARFQS
jgi:hypothetical protein